MALTTGDEMVAGKQNQKNRMEYDVEVKPSFSAPSFFTKDGMLFTLKYDEMSVTLQFQ